MARLTAEEFEKNRERIKRAALRCFSTSGYKGVTTREIAEAANVPLGSLYNYYEDKLALFRAIVDEQSNAFLSPDNDVIRYFLESDFPNDLDRLADAIGESLETYEPYFKLMYVDVVEFDGVHIREVFSGLEEKFKAVMEDRFRELGLLGPARIDPAFALVTIYLTFYQYFVLSKLFGASKIFGKRTDKQVVDGMIGLLVHGIGRGP